MSELTAGTLFRREEWSSIQQRLDRNGLDYKVRELNDYWSAFFLEDDWLENPFTVQVLEEISQLTPILYFYNAEDHGWGYRLMEKGSVRAALNVNYELVHAMAADRFEERHPGQDPYSDEGRGVMVALVNDLYDSPEYRAAVADQFAQANPEAFRLFLDESALSELSSVLSPALAGNPEALWDQVEAFKACLGITEMSWLNFAHADYD